MISIRAAAAEDLDVVKELLVANDLPVLGVAEHFSGYLVAVDGGNVVGAIGLEPYGDTGLLRSAVVADSHKGKGIGAKLVDQLLEAATKAGVRRLVLLTNTAEGWFAGKGFRSIDRSTVTGPVTSSIEFTEACPAHAVCMEKLL